jgi:hypothetical protein
MTMRVERAHVVSNERLEVRVLPGQVLDVLCEGRRVLLFNHADVELGHCRWHESLNHLLGHLVVFDLLGEHFREDARHVLAAQVLRSVHFVLLAVVLIVVVAGQANSSRNAYFKNINRLSSRYVNNVFFRHVMYVFRHVYVSVNVPQFLNYQKY